MSMMDFVSNFPWTLVAQWFNIILLVLIVIFLVKLGKALLRYLEKGKSNDKH